MPFDWKTPIGYLVMLVYQLFMLIFICVNCSCILCFIIGVCLVLMLVVKDIERDFNIQNVCENANDDQMKLRKKFYNVIQFHSNTKQFSRF